MHSVLHYACGYQIGTFALILAGSLAVSAQAANVMPTAQQNALVDKYCAVCHTDVADNGGLSLEHFDAAHAAPSLMAMLLSKITQGASLETVRKVPSNAEAAR
jgi:ubiquinone biosynthesis protein Coq4